MTKAQHLEQDVAQTKHQYLLTEYKHNATAPLRTSTPGANHCVQEACSQHNLEYLLVE